MVRVAGATVRLNRLTASRILRAYSFFLSSFFFIIYLFYLHQMTLSKSLAAGYLTDR